MKIFRTMAAAAFAAALLGIAGAANAQFFGGMGGGMMGPGFGSGAPLGRTQNGSGIMRGTGYGFGMGAGSYCYGMMGPATGYGYSMMGPWTGSSYADPDAAVQACLSALHTQLGITAGQEAAWQAFAAAVDGQAAGMLQFHQVLQTTATVPERAAQFAQFMQQRAGDAAAIAQALGALYAVLTPEQQALFNRYFSWAA